MWGELHDPNLQAKVRSMKNPLDKDVIARNAITVGTGVAAYRNGKPGLEAAAIGVAWGYFYKTMSMAVVLLLVCAGYCWGHGEWEYVYVQAVLNTVVCGVTYCKLIVLSNFKQRWFFRLWWPVARLFPYTSRVWLYLALFLPLWTITFFQNHHFDGGLRW